MIANKKHFEWSSPSIVNKVIVSLNQNDALVTSTDTILGLLAPLTEKGFFKLNQIKGDRKNNPYLILIASPEKLPFFIHYENLSYRIKNLINHCWPGPVSIVFQANPTLAPFLQTPTKTIALRCPKHKKLQAVLNAFPGLFSTSANKSNNTPPTKISELHAHILASVTYVILDQKEYGSQQQTNLPSTIIDVSLVMQKGEHEPIKVVREGIYPIKELERIYGAKFES